MPENTTTPDAPTHAPADLEEFDLDGFIAGSVRPSKVVPIVRDRDLGGRVLELRQRVIDLSVQQSNDAADGKSRRRAGAADTPELESVRADYEALLGEARGALVYVRVEDATRGVRKQARKDSGGSDVDRFNSSVLSQVAKVYVLDPREHPDAPGKVLTLAQWDTLAEVIGVEQYDMLIAAVNEVTETGVSPDFSLPASLSPAGGVSSRS